jgi:tRNA 2-selenouridine synthase
VFVESESKKVGNLRVPDAVMEKMRASPCISLTLSRPNRVRLLMEDYRHFTAIRRRSTAAGLPGANCTGARRSRLARLANGGAMPELVDQLLVEHYDPAYLRSIDRNFVQFGQAEVLELKDIASRFPGGRASPAPT